MKMYDVSMTITPNMTTYGNKESNRPEFKISRNHDTGTVHESELRMNLHTGTHVDAPLHMIKDGSTIDTLDISRLYTDCTVYDLTEVVDRITSEDLKKRDIRKGTFILLKTRNSFFDGFDPNFVFVEASGAEYLKEIGISGVGIDNLGIERSQPGHETHKTLLGNGIIILEGLRLADIPAGNYKLIALPIKLSGTEGAPCRAVLVEE